MSSEQYRRTGLSQADLFREALLLCLKGGPMSFEEIRRAVAAHLCHPTFMGYESSWKMIGRKILDLHLSEFTYDGRIIEYRKGNMRVFQLKRRPG